MTSQVIPAEAIEAALETSLRQLGLWGKNLPNDLIEARRTQLTEILEAAAPYMLAAVLAECDRTDVETSEALQGDLIDRIRSLVAVAHGDD